VKRSGALLLSLLLGTSSSFAKPVKPVRRAEASKRVHVIVPTPRPAPVRSAPEAPMDLSHAMPGKTLATLPSSAQQLKSLSSELKEGQPQLAGAKEKTDTLAKEAAALKKKLIETAARIESLERQQIDAEVQIVRLSAEDVRLSKGFANDRVAVTKLLAVLERLQHDMPPALAMHPDDALAAARGAMLIGASLPPVYAQVAQLSQRIDALKRTRAALEQQKASASDTAARLNVARGQLDELLGEKEREAKGAAENYDTLRTRLQEVAHQAADFQALLARVRTLRQDMSADMRQGVVTVEATSSGSLNGLARNSLVTPVVGAAIAAKESGTPGLSYATRPGAQVIAPSDGKVLYAGPYHKSGQVLILEITTGYDVVLAGLGRVTVKPNDQLLAGEPVGTMPPEAADNRLYFELRHDGRGQSPEPWLKVNLRPAFGKANGT
jgi:septal ring factor EnvC (AmiA/AmiB activator)